MKKSYQLTVIQQSAKPSERRVAVFSMELLSGASPRLNEESLAELLLTFEQAANHVGNIRIWIAQA